MRPTLWMDDPSPDQPEGIRPATRLIGRLAIAAMFVGAGCVSLVILGLIALHADEWASADQPVQEMTITVARLKGTATFLDGGTAFLYEARDPEGALRDTMAPFMASPGDRFRWRYRRSRLFGVFMPIEATLCGAPEPC